MNGSVLVGRNKITEMLFEGCDYDVNKIENVNQMNKTLSEIILPRPKTQNATKYAQKNVNNYLNHLPLPLIHNISTYLSLNEVITSTFIGCRCSKIPSFGLSNVKFKQLTIAIEKGHIDYSRQPCYINANSTSCRDHDPILRYLD